MPQTKIRSICLVGFMGAGKTSVGRALAERLGWRFVDLDDVIEARQGRRIADIFREDGEAVFRAVEAEALQALLSERNDSPLVLALGGGAFVQPENARAIAAARTPVVFLDAPMEELRRRCAGQAGVRPLFQDENQFRQLYEARRRFYMEADVRLDTAGLSIDEAAMELLWQLGLEPTERETHE